MLVLLLLLLATPAFSFTMCDTYFITPRTNMNIGLTPCLAECSSMVAVLSNGERWEAAGCDMEGNCREGNGIVYTREEFNRLIARAPEQLPKDVTQVTVDSTC